MVVDSDRERNWDLRLKNQAGKGWDNYRVKRIDLSVARANEPMRLPGEFLCVSNSSSAAAVAKVRLNRIQNPSLDLEEDVEIKTIFTVLYITNDALADQWIDLTIGINFEYKKKMIECGVTKTGQVTEYQAGDDGTYEAGWLKGRLNANNRTRFVAKTIGDDDLVLDRATGLTWAADGNAAGCNNNAAIAWAAGIVYAEALTFAGFSDWRIPNVKELVSLLDYFVVPIKINIAFFPNPSGAYWTSTTSVDNVLNAFRVQFLSATVENHKLKTDLSQRIRCVRAGL